MTDEQNQDQDGPRKPAKGQMEIDWNRCTRRTWIERLILPAFEREDCHGRRMKVRTSRSKHLLRILESYARDGGACFLKLGTIAKAMGVDERTASRAIADGVAQGLLTVDRSFYKHAASRYEIEWFRVKEFILEHPETERLINQEQSAVERLRKERNQGSGVNNLGPAITQDSTEVTPDNSQTTHDKLSVTHDKLSSTPDKLSVTHDMLSELETDHTSIRVCAVLNHSLNHVRKPSIKPCTPDIAQTAVVTESPSGGWPHPIDLQHLQNRDHIQRLWEHAMKFRFLSPDLRTRFFTLAKYVQRMTVARKVRNAGAYFTSQVIARNWLGETEDIRSAINAITILDSARNRRDR